MDNENAVGERVDVIEDVANNNQVMIDSLREAIEYLETHPGIPSLSYGVACTSVREKDAFREAAQAMGSFTKEANDYDYALVKAFGGFQVRVSINREKVCTKTVTWDCPEDMESLLADPVETL